MGDVARDRQIEEVESLEAIFADDFSESGTWKEDGVSAVAFTVTLSPTLTVRFRLPADYPEISHPECELTWTGVGDASAVRRELAEYVDTLSLGEEMVYMITTWCQEKLSEGFAEHASCVSADAELQAGYIGASTPVAESAATGNLGSTQAAGADCLPLASYFRAETLGEGGFGSVMQVYDEDGHAWAAKQFARSEDGGTDTTTLREIGLLRALRTSGAAHPNLVMLSDMATINEELCMIMAPYKCSLRDALIGGALEATKGAQLRVAKGLLSAVAFLHACSTMHRDIKPGNVMLTDDLDAVLIDFSLAKVDLGKFTEERAPRTAKEQRRKARGKKLKKEQENEEAKHSQGVGTPLYMAPEVINSSEYSEKADVWSSGIVLLEIFDASFREKFELCEKDKAAHALIGETVGRLGLKPIPSLLKALLEVDPLLRLSAQAALDGSLKGMPGGDALDIPSVRISSVPCTALPSLPEDMVQQIKRWVAFFRCSPPIQSYAIVYAARSEQAQKEPLHAVVLAARLFETDYTNPAPLYDLEELEDWLEEEEPDDEEMLDQLDGLESYFESEVQILREMDYRLY